MDLNVVGAVMTSALLLAGWNAMVKRGGDGLVVQAMVVGGGSVIVLPFLPLVSIPAGPVWVFLIGSALVHGVYFWVLAEVYRFGELSLVFPIARGAAPIAVAVAAGQLLGETLGGWQVVGLGSICCGLFLLAWSARAGGGGKAVASALFISGWIVAFTLLDGIGVRRAEAPQDYIAWLILLEGPPILLIAWWRRGLDFPRLARLEWCAAITGGLMSNGSYGLVLWAFSQAALAPVMALRETSVIFAALIGALVFGEAFGTWRIIAAVAVAVGAVLLNVGL